MREYTSLLELVRSEPLISDTKSALEAAKKNVITLNDLYDGLVKETNEIFKSHTTSAV